jgi:hypothetical protein
MTMKHIRTLIWIHAVYTLLTAVWPLVDIKSFMIITGHKTDIWLVKLLAPCSCQ